jgi:hypothetical protein
MKKIIFCIILISCSVTSFCQRLKPQERMRISDEYMVKSQHLKTAAWILLGSGIGMTAGGIILIASDSHINNYSYDNTLSSQEIAGAVLVYAGVLSSLGSIPLFIVSRVMHKRAVSASGFLEMEKAPSLGIAGLPVQPFPALGIKINL